MPLDYIIQAIIILFVFGFFIYYIGLKPMLIFGMILAPVLFITNFTDDPRQSTDATIQTIGIILFLVCFTGLIILLIKKRKTNHSKK